MIDHWSNVTTRGLGDGWNSNYGKERYRDRGHGIGVGQIDRNDDEKRESLRINLLYLAKMEPYPLMRNDRYKRPFHTSMLPFGDGEDLRRR